MAGVGDEFLYDGPRLSAVEQSSFSQSISTFSVITSYIIFDKFACL